MSDPTLLGSCYAAARKHLANAKVAQDNAILFGMRIYYAGKPGRDARFMQHEWNKRRSMHLEQALFVRAQIRELRQRLRAA